MQKALEDQVAELVAQKVNEAIEDLDIEPEVVKVLDKLDGVEDNVIDIGGGSSK